MVDILKFIDSKDIREHNRSTAFAPLEQAVLIYCSARTTVEEKIAAWKELLASYSEEEFQTTACGTRMYGQRNNREITAHTVALYEKTLSYRYDEQGVVFETAFYESNYPDSVELAYFSDYEKALAHLQALKQEYLDDEDLKDVPIQAKIQIKRLDDTSAHSGACYLFDNDLRLIDVYPDDNDHSDRGDMQDVFVYIPLPFQKGDILRTIHPGKKFYGVLPRSVEKECFSGGMRFGDMTDMVLTLDQFFETDKWGFGFTHFPLLGLERCDVNELPEEQKILILLSDVYRDKMEAGELLFLYSRYGEKAYQEVAGYRPEAQTTATEG